MSVQNSVDVVATTGANARSWIVMVSHPAGPAQDEDRQRNRPRNDERLYFSFYFLASRQDFPLNQLA